MVLNLNGQEVSVVIGPGTMHHMVSEADRYSHVVLMVSKTVDDLYADKIPKLTSLRGELTRIVLADGENLKNIRNYQKIIGVLIERGVERDSLVIYIGGGTVGDLAGYVASTYKRGTNFLAVPSTLLAQIDSSIGGKNGINFSGIKNVIGTFYNPSTVIVDTDFLKGGDTLKLRDGICEMIKYGIIKDETILRILAKYDDINSLSSGDDLIKLISKSIKIKGEIANRDFFDRTGERSILNFGHTIGHSIESATKNRISHGPAIATGMLVETYIGERMGITKAEIREEVRNQMNRFSIQQVSLRDIGIDSMLEYLKNDKKMSQGSITMSIPEDFGTHRNVKMTPENLRSHLRSFMETFDTLPAA
ncbi:MAG: 3-dehydroquinate synthase [Thermoplasmataceae archaeon]|jgi:3-dehydroquinate synthase|nr:3-dehydroquinate synthase [Candidatus Thermoplasmatota archaeon]